MDGLSLWIPLHLLELCSINRISLGYLNEGMHSIPGLPDRSGLVVRSGSLVVIQALCCLYGSAGHLLIEYGQGQFWFYFAFIRFSLNKSFRHTVCPSIYADDMQLCPLDAEKDFLQLIENRSHFSWILADHEENSDTFWIPGFNPNPKMISDPGWTTNKITSLLPASTSLVTVCQNVLEAN